MTAQRMPIQDQTPLVWTAPFDDTDRRWQAVVSRDENADGRFVYAVCSTGIYCRPSCASRKPARSNVAYFPLAEAAAQAGYRPCKRCRPDRVAPADPRLAVVRRVCAVIAASDDGDRAPSLAALAEDTGFSPHHLQRMFTAVMGVSPRQYGEALRVLRLKRALKSGEAVASAGYGAGYGSSSRLYEQAAANLGMTPASYAKGGTGAHIGFIIVDHPAGAELGRLLVATTVRGICMIALGDSDAALERSLREEFPLATIGCSEPQNMADLVRQVLAVAESRLPHKALPLDIRATAFQRRVWQCLQTIPRGETRSYADIAAELGCPTAARAVGRACATNPVSLVIPCHRAIGRDGNLHGYRWGLDRKAALLRRERGGAGDEQPEKSGL